MTKYISYIALIPLILLALNPPWSVQLDCRINGLLWLWVNFIAGFLTFLYFNFKVNIFLKLFVLWCFIGCFLSRAPYMSFTMFWSVIACAYYYVLCKQITDFTPVKKVIQAIFFFTILLLIMQGFGKDTLLNFNQKEAVIIGLIGNKMISSSFICTLAPFLIINPLNWIALIIISFITTSSGAILAIFTGLGVYAWTSFKRLRILIVALALIIPAVFIWKTGDIGHFGYGRAEAWGRCAQLSLKQPLGYGVAIWKLLFPVLSMDLSSTISTSSQAEPWEYENTKGKGLRWGQAHNFLFQLLFETGYPGLISFLCFIGSIIRTILRNKDYLKLAGLAIIATSGMFHFADRTVNCVLILCMFLAFCEHKEISHGTS